jgi:N-acetylmuramic acid 6-phosphate etherase
MQKKHPKAEKFLKHAKLFQLGDLSSEGIHPSSAELSKHAKENIGKGIFDLKNIDLFALNILKKKLPTLKPLKDSINEVLNNNGRVFLCGCGATGRLSLALETLWRKDSNGKHRDSIISFMAGGDVALINSIESFEDHPEFGARQLKELGFKDGDLLISCTEGGETPFVIGATEKAVELSSVPPYFLYCNPEVLLKNTVERSKNILTNSKIHKINLDVGPMALSGSTRMQASTVLMLGVGLCLFYHSESFSEVESQFQKFYEELGDIDFSFLTKFIEFESSVYLKDEYIYYETNEEYGISILTDTTERSPTFSLGPFENFHEKNCVLSRAYLLFSHHTSSLKAWEGLLGRSPRTLDWKNVNSKTNDEWLLGFDFSRNLIRRRADRTDRLHHFFKIFRSNDKITFELDEHFHEQKHSFSNLFFEHIFLKLALNTLSTLVMGRLGRYEGNVMTWVRPSNNKLIDRSIRYVAFLLAKDNIKMSYEEIAHALFFSLDNLGLEESIVLETYKNLKNG